MRIRDPVWDSNRQGGWLNLGERKWLNSGERHRALFKNLSDLHNSPTGGELRTFWLAIVEANGAAAQVQNWPAQKLLDYGNAVLGALRPGMVYARGTDSGCFIPLMLNETSDGEQHIMLTQNALADQSYLDYFSSRYGNQLTTLTSEDSVRAFEDASEQDRHCGGGSVSGTCGWWPGCAD